MFILIIPLLPTAVEGGDVSQISGFLVGAMSPTITPFGALFVEDPQFTYSGYPVRYPLASVDDRRRTLRRYYPRTRDELIDNFDVMVFCEARIEHMTPRQFHDLDFAFREGAMVGAASPGLDWNAAFLSTILYHIMPVWQYDQYTENFPYRVVFRGERDPVFSPFVELGVERIVGNNFHVMSARAGATIWADIQPKGLPWLVSMRPGGGNAGTMWIFTGRFDPPWWGLMHRYSGRNPYAIDIAANIVFYSMDMPKITDIFARRQARAMLSSFKTSKLLVIHMMEWADNFGANILPLSERLTAVEEEAQEAMEFYVEQEYDATISFMDSMADGIIDITDEAVRLKNQALFWVYISEWLVVSGVSLSTGTALWHLMVRRRIYRAVGSTRLRAMDRD
jgi:hypothetical protein